MELDFEMTDPAYPTVRLSEVLDCQVDLLEVLRTDEDGVVVFVRLHGDDAGDLRERVGAVDVAGEVSVVQSVEGELLAEYVPSKSIVGTLMRAGVIPQTATASEGVVTVTGVASSDRDPRRIVKDVRAEHPSVEFTGKRTRDVVTPLVTEASVRSLFGALLTDRQWEAVRLAHERGYFDQPQGHSQTELAAEMGISQKTFSQHLNAAQRKLLSLVFDG